MERGATNATGSLSRSNGCDGLGLPSSEDNVNFNVEKLRIISGQSRRRALHCTVCQMQRYADPPLEIGHSRIRVLCSGHSRDRANESHAQTLRLLADLADELIRIMEAKL